MIFSKTKKTLISLSVFLAFTVACGSRKVNTDILKGSTDTQIVDTSNDLRAVERSTKEVDVYTRLSDYSAAEATKTEVTEFYPDGTISKTTRTAKVSKTADRTFSEAGKVKTEVVTEVISKTRERKETTRITYKVKNKRSETSNTAWALAALMAAALIYLVIRKQWKL